MLHDLFIFCFYPALGLLLALAFRFGKPWLDAKIGVENSNLVFGWAEKFVKSAEQTMKDQPGSDKYNYVIDALQDLIESKNIKFDETALEAAIEAAVLEYKKHTELAPAAVGNLLVADGATVTTTASTVPPTSAPGGLQAATAAGSSVTVATSPADLTASVSPTPPPVQEG